MAVKCVDLESTADDLEDIQREIEMLSMISCMYLTKYFGSYAVGEVGRAAGSEAAGSETAASEAGRGGWGWRARAK